MGLGVETDASSLAGGNAPGSVLTLLKASIDFTALLMALNTIDAQSFG